jgi:hypothetical protein
VLALHSRACGVGSDITSANYSSGNDGKLRGQSGFSRRFCDGRGERRLGRGRDGGGAVVTCGNARKAQSGPAERRVAPDLWNGSDNHHVHVLRSRSLLALRAVRVTDTNCVGRVRVIMKGVGTADGRGGVGTVALYCISITEMLSLFASCPLLVSSPVLVDQNFKTMHAGFSFPVNAFIQRQVHLVRCSSLVKVQKESNTVSR